MLQVDAVDRFGYLALHYAVSQNAPLEMVSSIIAAYPRGAWVPDKKQNVALHLAIASGANSALVRLIYSAFPAASRKSR
jgi:ankyrin repeat protein